MHKTGKKRNRVMHASQAGFSLLETMVALAVLLGVGGIVMSGMTQMMKTQVTLGNRTEMHANVRSATELLTQEIGQAGKVSFPAPVILSAAAAANATSITVNNATDIFGGEQLVLDGGSVEEWVTVNPNGVAGNSVSLTKNLVYAHNANVPVSVFGAFSSGIVPPSMTNGSTATILKLYGDINGDGNLVYIEYTCSQGTQASPGFLYRNLMPYTQATKPANDKTMILLSNVLQNPNDANNNPVACFTYQTQTDAQGNTYITDVAVTLTVQTQNIDPVTHQQQQETKALLNVSPRNVFDAYQNSTLGFTQRVQPMPPSVQALLP
jgi:prepilin-type N-terminal cleavage/methylation domain-containing protein